MSYVREPPGSLYDEGPGRERAPSHFDAAPSLPESASSAEILRGAPMSVLWFEEDGDDRRDEAPSSEHTLGAPTSHA